MREKMNSVFHRDRQEEESDSADSSPAQKKSSWFSNGNPTHVPRASLLDRFRHKSEDPDQTTIVDAQPAEGQPVKLGAPPEIYQFRDDEEPSFAGKSQAEREEAAGEALPDPVTSGTRPDASQYFPNDAARRAQRTANARDAMQRQPGYSNQYSPQGQPERPLDMTGERSGQFIPLPESAPATGNFPYQGTPLAEPARIPAGDDPATSPAAPDMSKTQAPKLVIPHIALCNAVRKYEDISTLNPQSLRAGQEVLLYASLENYQSLPTAQGYRTLTLSSLEVRTKSGQLVTRQPLGTATDMSRQPRREYYVAHPIRIPDELPAGEYVFNLSIYDLTSRQTSHSRIAVQIMGDRTLPGGTDGTAESAMRPAGYRR